MEGVLYQEKANRILLAAARNVKAKRVEFRNTESIPEFQKHCFTSSLVVNIFNFLQ